MPSARFSVGKMTESLVAQDVLNAYNSKREELMAMERGFRHDKAFIASLSPVEQQACAIVSRIRDHESQTLWNPDYEASKGDCFPGMMFTLAKERMESSQLWKAVKPLPKGALLHAHLEAMVDMDWFWNLVIDTEGICMFSDRPLVDAAALKEASVRFAFVPGEDLAEPLNIYYEDSYIPNKPVSIKSAANFFPETLLGESGAAGRSGFIEFLTSRTTITPDESLRHHEGIDKIWEKFQSIFMLINAVIYYEPIYRQFVRHLLESLYADGIHWVDFRAAFHMTLVQEKTGKALSKHRVLEIFGEEVEAFKKATNGGFWGARMIWTAIRGLPKDIIFENMKECIEAKKAYPQLVAGYDLVGQEGKGQTLQELLPLLLWFRETCEKEGVEIPFFFHAGETNEDGGPTDNNLFDAILLGTKRIGHGFSIYKHPHLMELAKQKHICIEMCPISNEVLRLNNSILSHPLPALMANGLDVTINNDDPGILGQKASGSLTHDYWQVIQAYDNVGLGGLGALAETSVRFGAYGEDGAAEKRLVQWRKMWTEYCEWIVKEFGEQWGQDK